MGRAGIEAYRHLFEEAFRGRGIEKTNESQALLTNLSGLAESEWRALPPGAARSVESIVVHVASVKLMYDDYAFGAGRLAWDDAEVEPWADGEAPVADALRWLETMHERVAASLARLADDDELDRERPTNWGGLRPTRWLLATLITHDAYHAGEINHIRSIIRGDDRWRHDQAVAG